MTLVSRRAVGLDLFRSPSVVHEGITKIVQFRIHLDVISRYRNPSFDGRP